jgi:rare lipoprotein A
LHKHCACTRPHGRNSGDLAAYNKESVLQNKFVAIIAISASLSFGAVAPTLAQSPRTQSGIASVYSTESGNKTASGQRLSPGALTAAHRSLPFGTKVRVTNKRNGKNVVVTINDRGPFVRGRIIDLTPASASAIGLGWSVTPVQIEVM